MLIALTSRVDHYERSFTITKIRSVKDHVQRADTAEVDFYQIIDAFTGSILNSHIVIALTNRIDHYERSLTIAKIRSVKDHV
jgi:hypothetical protein